MKSLKLGLILTTLFIANTTQTHEHEHEKHHTVEVTVNTTEVFKNSLRGKNIIKKLGDEEAAAKANFAPMHATLQAKQTSFEQQQNSYNDKVKSLEAKAKMISEEAYSKEIDDLQNLRRQIEETKIDIERYGKKFNEDAQRSMQKLEALHKKEMEAFQIEVFDVIKEASISHGWDFVQPREGLLYASPRVDKTSIIISELDKAELKRKEATQPTHKASAGAAADKKPATPTSAVKKAA